MLEKYQAAEGQSIPVQDVVKSALEETQIPKSHITTLAHLLFNCHSIRKQKDKSRIRVLVNMKQNDRSDNMQKLMCAKELTTHLRTVKLPSSVTLYIDNTSTLLHCVTEYTFNQTRLIKEARFFDGYWELWLAGKKVNLDKLSVNHQISTASDIQNILKLLTLIKPCLGKPDPTAVIVREGLVDECTVSDNSSQFKTKRSKYCSAVLGWFSKASFCGTCGNMARLSTCPETQREISTANNENEVELVEQDHQDMHNILSKLFATAKPELKILMKAQLDALKVIWTKFQHYVFLYQISINPG